VELKLPPKIVSRGDLNRILRELNRFNDYLVGSQFKNEGQDTVSQNISPLLAELASINSYDLMDENRRKELYGQLEAMSAHAPGLHISFTSAPSPSSLEKVIIWLRGNIHPQILLSVGLQPTIAAGCVLRTPNRVIDMGLKQTLMKKQPLLLEMIKGVNHG
jgi:F0F1-type ATP synthase delta subunit